LAEKTRIALGADHAGLALKDRIREYLVRQGYEVEDAGTHSPERVDYPDFGEQVARRVAGGQARFGVLVCGTGLGMEIVANKIPGIRAALCSDTLTAYFARAHNDANVLALGGRLVDEATAQKILDTWLSTPFEGGRHQRRIEKINLIEQKSHLEKDA